MSATTYFYKWLGLIFSTGGRNKGKGDVAFRSALFAIFRRDYRILWRVKHLLQIRRRWPEVADDPRGWEFDHRSPFKMTRDPYWTSWAAAYLMNKPHYIKETPAPWYIWRPHFSAWRKILITPTQEYLKYKRRYEFWQGMSMFFSFGKKPAFAIFLDCLAAWTVKSTKVQGRLLKHIPEWNLCCRQMVLHPDWLKDKDRITAFEPREGFIWQAEEYFDDRKLPLDQEYYMDKEALWFVWIENLKRHDIII